MKKKKLSIDFGKALLFGAAAVQATQWSQAFELAHGEGSSLGTVGGLLMGAVIVFSVAFISGRLAKIRAKKAKLYATIAFFVLMGVSPLILSPAIIVNMNAELLTLLGKYISWGWAFLMAFAPELAIAGVAFADGSLISTPKQSVSTTDAVAKKSVSTAKIANALRKQADALAEQYKCTASGCDFRPSTEKLIKSKNPMRSAVSSKAAHTKAQHEPIPVELSLDQKRR